MTTPLSIAPPPLQIPPDFAQDKIKGGFFGALVNTLYQLWTNVYSIRAKVSVETTDDTNTAAIRIPCNVGRTVMIVANIVARRTGGTSGTAGDSAWYTLSGAYKNITGTLTGVGTPDLIGGEDQISWNVGFGSAGEFITVVVKGAVNNDITWDVTVSSYEVGS